MSVSSILAFAIAGVAAKVKSVQVARPSDDPVPHAVMKQMARELREARARVAELEGDVARANVQYRRDQELIDLWRERALFAEAAPRGALQQAALQQAQAQAQTQLAQSQGLQNYQAAQNAMVYGNSLLGTQSLVDAELWCNCVPARHDMFLRGE
jgi:hypothetical protein